MLYVYKYIDLTVDRLLPINKIMLRKILLVAGSLLFECILFGFLFVILPIPNFLSN